MRALLIAAAIMLGACTHHGEPIEEPAMRISGEWVEATEAQHKATITFADGAASGSTGCNRWTAQVDQTSGLRFGVGAVTEMACPGQAMDAERRFLDVLAATRSAEDDGGMLTLRGAAGEDLMRFTRPSGALLGVTWRRVDDGDANPHGGTLTFEENRASGHAGCNRWFAALTRDGAQLRFGDVGTTRMACAEPAMAAEARFLAMLQVIRSTRMDGDDLILADHAGREVARFVRER